MDLRGSVRAAALSAALSLLSSGCSKALVQESVPAPAALGALTDERDGKTYRTTVIGGMVWMAENLNYRPESGNSWCYADDSSFCGKYGRLYDFETAASACPAGYHLPSSEEWDILARSVGGEIRPGKIRRIADWSGAGKALKAENGWRDPLGGSGGGDDAYGFSALPGGYRDFYDSAFAAAEADGYWWTAADGVDMFAFVRNMYYGNDELSENYFRSGSGFSVRCVQDGTDAAEERAVYELRQQTAKLEEGKRDSAQRKIEKNITYFADPRDGKKYRAVKIDDRIWMAENLNYRSPSGSWCYGNDDANCAKYGRLYDWETAKKACPPGWYLPSYREWTSILDATASVSCLYTPGYWRGGRRLIAKNVRPYKADGGGRADRRDNADAYGFSALPGGYYDIDRVYDEANDVRRRPPYENETAGSFREADSSAYWWSSSYKYKYGADHARYFNMEFDDFSIHEDIKSGASAMSVRCVLGGGERADSMRFAKEQKQMKRENAERKKREERREYEKKQAEERAKLPIENTSTYFTDPRDGQTYRAVTIIGKKWMAQNLNYPTDSSWCYDSADSNCVKYGRLYNWSAAQTACPAGYHLPSHKEWADLGLGMELEWYARKELHFVRGDDDRDSYWYNVGEALKAKSGWNDHNGKSGGGDDYGFSLLPGGSYVYGGKYGPDFHDAGSDGYWWTDAEKDDGYSSYWRIGVDGYLSAYRGGGSTAHSVRCAADD